MKPKPAFDIARTCAKALRKRKTLYATNAICQGLYHGDDKAWITVTMNGRRYKVTVEQVDG